jgi:hypothetical protein
VGPNTSDISEPDEDLVLVRTVAGAPRMLQRPLELLGALLIPRFEPVHVAEEVPRSRESSCVAQVIEDGEGALGNRDSLLDGEAWIRVPPHRDLLHTGVPLEAKVA